jgi:hypothetical protein
VRNARPASPPARRRRARRALVGGPSALAAWAVLAGLPFSPAKPTAGEMHTAIITLSGPAAEATAPASTDGGTSSRALRVPPTVAGPGWSADLDVDDGTQAVAASWTGAAHGAVQVRGLAADGWTEWTDLAADSADAPGPDAPDASTRDTGGMAWFSSEGVDEVQVRVAQGKLHDLQVQTMRYEEPSAPSGLTAAIAPPVAGAAAAQPDIQPRSLWTTKGWATQNSGCSSGPVTSSGGVKFAVVHHTVNSNTYAASDVPAMLAAIYAYHTGTNGWCDIAYNFVVDRFGRIWEARSGGITKAIVGGHAQGFNTGSMGVSFLGQFEPGASPTAAAPTTAALDAAGKLIGWKLGLFGTPASGTVTVTSGGSNKWPAGTSVTINRISGHRDLGLTACPGQELYDELAHIRTVAIAAQGSNNSTTTTTAPTTTTTTTPPPPSQYAPFKSAWGLVTQQYQDVLRRSPSAADHEFWDSRAGNTWTPGQFIAHLVTSSEADDRVHAVTRLYKAYFLRNPDHSGLTYWLARRGDGRTLVSISSTFAGSSEFKRRYGTLDDGEFVDRVYQNVFGRAPDASGRAYWVKKLGAGTSRGQVMANFSQSSEYINKTNEGVRVVALYESMLQRSAPSDEYTLFVSSLRNASTSVTSIATWLYDSDEYRARFS